MTAKVRIENASSATGDRKWSSWSAARGTISSLVSILMPSASGCPRPKMRPSVKGRKGSPVRFGPGRFCTRPSALRSTRVSSANSVANATSTTRIAMRLFAVQRQGEGRACVAKSRRVIGSRSSESEMATTERIASSRAAALATRAAIMARRPAVSPARRLSPPPLWRPPQLAGGVRLLVLALLDINALRRAFLLADLAGDATQRAHRVVAALGDEKREIAIIFRQLGLLLRILHGGEARRIVEAADEIPGG